jgi:chromosome segregation ATPase
MRKPVLVLLIVLVVALLGASLALYQKLQTSRTDYATLQADEKATTERYEAAVDEIASIQESLEAIDTGDQGTQALATQLEAEKSLTKDRGEEARARIARIKESIARANARIHELDQQLKESGVKVAGLEKLIRGLRQTVVEKEAVIVQLTARVDELQTQVTGLTAEVQAGQQTIRTQTETIQTQTAAIEDSRRRLGTIFYVIGTKKELSKADLVESKGGVLGLGKTVRPTGRIDESKFTALDTDRETVILIPATKAKVVSPQPVASYELQLVGEQLELRILDAHAFRTVKHVIIMTD